MGNLGVSVSVGQAQGYGYRDALCMLCGHTYVDVMHAMWGWQWVQYYMYVDYHDYR